jgi:hypothetical protein
MRSSSRGSVTVEQLSILGVVALGVLGVFVGLGGAVETTLIGTGATAAATGSDPFGATAGASWSADSADAAEPDTSIGTVGPDDVVAVDPRFGSDGMGGDEPTPGEETLAVALRERLEAWSRDHDGASITRERLDEMAASSDPDEAALGALLRETPTLFHAFDTGAGEGDVDGNISLEDLEEARYETAAIGAFRAEPGMPESREEAEEVLDRYEFLADTAAGRGGRDGEVSVDDLAAIVGDESLTAIAPGLREAAAYLLEHHAGDYQADDCSGFSFCQIGEAYDASGLDSAVDFVWDDLGIDSLVSNTFDDVFWRTLQNFEEGAGSWYEWPVDAFLDVATFNSQVSGNLVMELWGLPVWGMQSLTYDEPEHWGLPYDGREPLRLYGEDGPVLADVEQQDLGDCVAMAGLAAIVSQNPDIVTNAIRDNGDGTYTVTFHENRPPGFFWDREWQTHEVTVDAEVPLDEDGSPLYADVNDGVLWVAIMEKAWAEYRGGYHRINGDNGTGLLEALTGHNASFSHAAIDEAAQRLPGDNPRIPSMERLGELHDGGYAMIVGAGKNPGPRIIGSHMQYVLDVDVEAGTITVGNPWGTDHTPRVFTYDEFANGFSMFSAVSTEPLDE